jgi:hypothetical protein
MISRDSQIEADAKKALAVKDFDLLSTPGILGDYKECELTHIYLIENDKNKLLHYYAVLSYEEFIVPDNKLKELFLTQSPITINKKYKIGIKQSRVSFEKAREIFKQLCGNNLIIDGTSFNTAELLTAFPKTHIPALWKNTTALLQKVLKPNFWGDNYIIEFFSNQNPFNGLLFEKDFVKVNEEIKKYISIDLDSINDRIGSFIFQFPITLIKATGRPTNDWCNAMLSVSTYPPFKQNDNITTIISTHFDDLITGYNTFDGICENQIIEVGDSRDFELLVTNKQNKLIYHHFKGNFMRYFNISGNIGIHNSEPRIFKNSDGEEIHINLFSNGFSTGSKSDGDYAERIRKRMQHNDIIKMNSQFRIFNKQRKKALSYVKELIQSNSSQSSEIWMLDPYLQSQDIIDTLYYLSLFDVKLKCITSYKKSRLLFDSDEKNEGNKSDVYYFNKFKSNQKEYLLSHSNNLGIILEFRTTHDTNGFNFHDRFLFFIPKDTEAFPTVYSLGTSINSLGKAHHIIQRIPDSRKLVHTFQELWELLNHETDQIIKLSGEKEK